MKITFVESKIGGVVLSDDGSRDFAPLPLVVPGYAYNVSVTEHFVNEKLCVLICIFY